MKIKTEKYIRQKNMNVNFVAKSNSDDKIHYFLPKPFVFLSLCTNDVRSTVFYNIMQQNLSANRNEVPRNRDLMKHYSKMYLQNGLRF